MALTVEDGTGVSGADTFITADELDATSLALFNHGETGNTSSKESALRRAWYYMKSLSWKPSKTAPYPAFGGTIPEDVKTAQAILAHHEKTNVNGLAPSVVAGQQKILTRVGEIGWTPTGQTGVDAQRATVTMAMDLLKPYLSGTGNTRFIDRG